MHENLTRRHDVKASSDRGFGLVFAAAFLILGLMPLLHDPSDPVRLWALGLAAAFLGLALFWTVPLRPLNRVWLKFGLLLHAVVNPVVMAVLFFGTVLPVALVMRLFGGDPLRLRRQPEAPSYWIPRQPPGPAPNSMKNQF